MTQFTRKLRLTNGLTVVYEHNDAAHIVSLTLGVKVGSVHETDDESGICHLIEHMVFKGTRSFKPGEIATLVESHGGELNAYTSLDQTVYYINLPSRHFGLGLRLMKEMVFDATMDPTELEREKEVIVEEIRRGNDNPQRVLRQTVFKSFFDKHNYRRPVIGTVEHVRSFTTQKVRDFYRQHYNPRNMILGICGDVTENEFSHELEKQFRFQTAAPVVERQLPQEPPKTGHRIVTRQMDIKATHFDLAFDAPNLTHADVPALDILSHLLGESETSLLEQTTRQKEQLVHTIYSSCFTPRYHGIFMIEALVDPRLVNRALASIRNQITFLQTHLIEDEKIERAKLLARSQLIYESQTCDGTARKWITYETIADDYNFDETYLENIGKLTAVDIQKAARKYLDIQKSVLVVLHPKKIKIDIDPSLYKKTVPRKKSAFRRLHQKKDAGLYELDNGIRVIVRENHRLPLIAIKTASLGGLRYETPATNGINHLLSNVLVKSTKNYSQVALAEKCEWLAGHLAGYAGRNSLGLSFTFLSEKLHQAMPLLTDVILAPALNPREIRSEVSLQREAIKNLTDNPGQTVFRLVLERLFKGHPYRFHLLGRDQSVKNLGATQLKNYLKKVIVPKNLVFSVVGDCETHTILELINNEFKGLKHRPFQRKKIKKPAPPKKVISVFEAQAKEQAHIAIGFLGASIHDSDKYALEIINNILSGQGGRLFLELRDKQSLAYTVTSTMVAGLEVGYFGTYMGTEPAKVNTAIRETLHQLERLHTQLVSKEELERAKNYIIGNHEIDHQKYGAIAMQFALNELYGVGMEEFFEFQKKIMRVTRKDIQRVARKYIDLDRYVIGVVGPEGCLG